MLSVVLTREHRCRGWIDVVWVDIEFTLQYLGINRDSINLPCKEYQREEFPECWTDVRRLSKNTYNNTSSGRTSLHMVDNVFISSLKSQLPNRTKDIEKFESDVLDYFIQLAKYKDAERSAYFKREGESADCINYKLSKEYIPNIAEPLPKKWSSFGGKFV